jgi:hypothetical protein
MGLAGRRSPDEVEGREKALFPHHTKGIVLYKSVPGVSRLLFAIYSPDSKARPL